MTRHRRVTFARRGSATIVANPAQRINVLRHGVHEQTPPKQQRTRLGCVKNSLSETRKLTTPSSVDGLIKPSILPNGGEFRPDPPRPTHVAPEKWRAKLLRNCLKNRLPRSTTGCNFSPEQEETSTGTTKRRWPMRFAWVAKPQDTTTAYSPRAPVELRRVLNPTRARLTQPWHIERRRSTTRARVPNGATQRRERISSCFLLGGRRAWCSHDTQGGTPRTAGKGVVERRRQALEHKTPATHNAGGWPARNGWVPQARDSATVHSNCRNLRRAGFEPGASQRSRGRESFCETIAVLKLSLATKKERAALCPLPGPEVGVVGFGTVPGLT